MGRGGGRVAEGALAARGAGVGVVVGLPITLVRPPVVRRRGLRAHAAEPALLFHRQLSIR